MALGWRKEEDDGRRERARWREILRKLPRKGLDIAFFLRCRMWGNKTGVQLRGLTMPVPVARSVPAVFRRRRTRLSLRPPERVALLVAAALLVAVAFAVACGESGEVLPTETPTPTPLVKPSDYPSPLVSPYPVHPEFTPTGPPEPPSWALPTPTRATSVTVLGRVIPIPPGGSYGGGIGQCGPPDTWPTGMVRCSDEMLTIVRGSSTVSWDDYGVVMVAVKPGDEADFQPTLDALSRVQWELLPASGY